STPSGSLRRGVSQGGRRGRSRAVRRGRPGLHHAQGGLPGVQPRPRDDRRVRAQADPVARPSDPPSPGSIAVPQSIGRATRPRTKQERPVTPAKLTVRHIRGRPVMVPFRRPPVAASGAFTHAALVLVDLETLEGITGRSYVFGFGAWTVK